MGLNRDLLILLFLLLASAFLRGSMQPQIEMLPEGGMYVFKEINDSVTFQCTVRNHSSSERPSLSLIWCWGDEEVYCITPNYTVLNSTSLIFERKHLQISDSGSYLCTFGDSSRNRHLKVGLPPLAPTDMICVANGFQKMECVWIVKKVYIPTTWKITYLEIQGSSFVPCFEVIGIDQDANISCKWERKSIIENYYSGYNVSISGMNLLGAIEEYFHVKPLAIVKPFPVSELQAHGSNTTIWLTWKIADELYTSIHVESVEYKIDFQNEYSESDERVIEHGNQSSSLILSNVRPYSIYSVQVRSRVNITKPLHWSDARAIKVSTKEGVPSRPPNTENGLYFITDEVLLVYIKNINKKDMNSKTIVYEGRFADKTAKTLHLIGSTLQVPLRRTDLSSQTKVRLFTRNSIGYSEEHTKLLITGEKVFSGTVWTELNRTNYKREIFIIRDDRNSLNISRILFFWCDKEEQDNYQICKSNVNWQESSDVRSGPLDVQVDFDSQLYGVALQYENGLSDGLHFSECNFKGKFVDDLVCIYPEYDGTTIQITLGFDICLDLPSMPLYFLVYYGDKDGVKERSCGEGLLWKTQNVTGRLKIKKIALIDLDLRKMYAVCMKIITNQGDDIRTNTVFTDVTVTEDKAVLQWIVILIAILCMLACGSMILCLRKCRALWKQQYAIFVPNIEPQRVLLDESTTYTNVSKTTSAADHDRLVVIQHDDTSPSSQYVSTDHDRLNVIPHDTPPSSQYVSTDHAQDKQVVYMTQKGKHDATQTTKLDESPESNDTPANSTYNILESLQSADSPSGEMPPYAKTTMSSISDLDDQNDHTFNSASSNSDSVADYVTESDWQTMFLEYAKDKSQIKQDASSSHECSVAQLVSSEILNKIAQQQIEASGELRQDVNRSSIYNMEDQTFATNSQVSGYITYPPDVTKDSIREESQDTNKVETKEFKNMTSSSNEPQTELNLQSLAINDLLPRSQSYDINRQISDDEGFPSLTEHTCGSIECPNMFSLSLDDRMEENVQTSEDEKCRPQNTVYIDHSCLTLNVSKDGRVCLKHMISKDEGISTPSPTDSDIKFHF